TQIVFPEALLEELDRAVQKRERSEFVVQAVQEKLQKLQLQRALKDVAGIWKDHPDLQKDAHVRRYLKRLRGADTRRRQKMQKAWHG
ncbi:MAG TPA: hypothetical protein VI958_06730, partial [Acidobacteriota bacterium]